MWLSLIICWNCEKLYLTHKTWIEFCVSQITYGLVLQVPVADG